MSWKDSLQRRAEVKAAFLEGFRAGAGPEALRAPEDEWSASEARRKLESPLEPPLASPQTRGVRQAGRAIGDAMGELSPGDAITDVEAWERDRPIAPDDNSH